MRRSAFTQERGAVMQTKKRSTEKQRHEMKVGGRWRQKKGQTHTHKDKERDRKREPARENAMRHILERKSVPASYPTQWRKHFRRVTRGPDMKV